MSHFHWHVTEQYGARNKRNIQIILLSDWRKTWINLICIVLIRKVFSSISCAQNVLELFKCDNFLTTEKSTPSSGVAVKDNDQTARDNVPSQHRQNHQLYAGLLLTCGFLSLIPLSICPLSFPVQWIYPLCCGEVVCWSNKSFFLCR